MTQAMLSGSSPFERFSDDDVRALIEDYPLAWVIAPATQDYAQLPLIGVYDEQGTLLELIGHMARSNPLTTTFGQDDQATILFQGPQAYVSPNDIGRRNWGPTWNYTHLRIQATITLEPEQTGAALDTLIDAVERDRPAPWHKDELGERYEGLIRAIIGFRARVLSVKGRFKLGQDESPEDYQAMRAATHDPAMLYWMTRTLVTDSSSDSGSN